ncbi:hypothetical protein [Streptomyces europaeiscabiei]|uniref:hypothetical protein n=1 Tax=Streptomyces europaeiscabiei TaxID=146819 RepID=UPI0029B9A662|nr:hypothetical protein [Streptomyces europaeiscabiei]MDX3775963.1 hypothetical protein [Streptomyces europaeiscabiei]
MGPESVVQQGSNVVLRSGSTVWSVDDAQERFRANSRSVGAELLVVSGSTVYGVERRGGSRTAPTGVDVVSSPVAADTVEAGAKVRLDTPVVAATAGKKGSLWTAQAASSTLLRIDGGRVIQRVHLKGVEGSLQLSSAAHTEVAALDTQSLRLTVLDAAGDLRTVSLADRVEAASDVALGVPSNTSQLVPLILPRARVLAVVDTGTGRTITFRLPVARSARLGRPVAAGPRVYVPDDASGTVLVMDTRTGRVMRTVRLAQADGHARISVSVRNGLVWGNDEAGPLAMVECQGRIRVLTKYPRTPDTAPTYSGGPAVHATSSGNPTPTTTPNPGPSTSPPTATDSARPSPSPTVTPSLHPSTSPPTDSARPSPSPSPTGSPAPSAGGSASGGAPTPAPGGSGPKLLSTLTIAPQSDYGRTSLAWDPASARLVTAHGPGSGRLWEVSDPRAPRRLFPVSDSEGGDTRGIAYAARGSLLFIAGRRPDTHDQDFSIYAAGGSAPPRLQSVTTIIGSQNRGIGPVAAVRPDGKALAAETGGAGGGNVTLWDTSDPTAPESAASVDGITGHLVKILDIGFSPDNKTMAVLSNHATTGARYLDLVEVTDVRAPSVTSTVRVGGGFSPMVFSPDGRYLVAPGEDTSAAVRAVEGSIVGELPTSSKVAAVAFSPSGTVLATGEQNGTVKLWDTAAGRAPTLLRTLTQRPTGIHHLAFDPRTGLLGMADAKTVQLWKLG